MLFWRGYEPNDPLMDKDPRSSFGPNADSIGAAVPVEIRAEHIDADVISALARWRNVDAHSLHALDPTLWTKGGEFITDSPAYLRALHGFVAEKIAFDDLSQAHRIEWPEQTNVPALDMIVDGSPAQIKEGATAYQQVEHALHRYPDVTGFITDPAAAQKLRDHGVDATGVEGLEPQEIASKTISSAAGLETLERAGQIHIPVLTTVFSICKYWERYDAGQIDGESAIKFAATDIVAQSVGTAAGLKLAAVYVVATGGFGVAVLPLTAAAIIGGLGLRQVVGFSRGRRLRQILQNLEDTRWAAEIAGEIITERSRAFCRDSVQGAWARIRQTNADAAATWLRLQDEVFLQLCTDAAPLSRDLIASIQIEAGRDRYAAMFINAFAEGKSERRFVELSELFAEISRSALPLPIQLRMAVTNWLTIARTKIAALEGLRRDLESDVSKMALCIDREVRLKLVSEYALLIHQLTMTAQPVVEALQALESESKRIGISRR